MSALSTRPMAMPVGTIPNLRSFLRHIWRYRDADNCTVLCAPPDDMFTLVLDDEEEVVAATSFVMMMVNTLGFHGRVKISVDFGNTLIAFRDLHALHAFLQLTALRPNHVPTRRMADFCLSILGFRWSH